MKKILKWIFISIVYICVLPFGLCAKLSHMVIKTTLFFDMFAQLFSLFPGFIGTTVRSVFYKQTLAESHIDLFIGFGSFISKIDTRIGRGVLINGNSTVGLADIGDGVVIANYVSVLSGGKQHNLDDPEKGILEDKGVYSRVIIGRDVFIGDQSVVMADIGEKTIVGAGTVITKEQPSYSIVVGNPAKVVRSRK